jgi:hypothetical protein
MKSGLLQHPSGAATSVHFGCKQLLPVVLFTSPLPTQSPDSREWPITFVCSSNTHGAILLPYVHSPDYSTFSGQPTGSGQTFSFDAWRSVRNVATDIAWYATDNEHQVAQCNRVLTFFRGLASWPNCESALLKASIL